MTPLLFSLCTLLPAAMILVGHYFNWRGVLGRPLRPIESYCWVVTFIVLTPSATILYAQRVAVLSPTLCVALFLASGIAAKAALVVAYGIDWLVARFRALEDRIDRAEYRAD